MLFEKKGNFKIDPGDLFQNNLTKSVEVAFIIKLERNFHRCGNLAESSSCQLLASETKFETGEYFRNVIFETYLYIQNISNYLVFLIFFLFFFFFLEI